MRNSVLSGGTLKNYCVSFLWCWLLLSGLVVSMPGTVKAGSDWEEHTQYQRENSTTTLRIASTTDTGVFEPVIEQFIQENPDIGIEYLVSGSADVYERFRKRSDQYDLLISSAMDLQLKLVNDGFAKRLDSIELPDWAHWRQSLFGFTLEPASIVVNRAAFSDLPIPRTRQAMIDILRTNPDRFRGKIGTYDVRQSGLGYLFATQDARASETYWRVMEIMGSLQTRLYCCSSDMIEDLAAGKIAISYNVLASYANARTDLADKIEVIVPTDYSNTMMRTALVSRAASNPVAAARFVQFLTSAAWSRPQSNSASLPPLIKDGAMETINPIPLEPGLMVFLDKMKRQLFLDEWESAVIQ